jgi:hypothetical protein
MAFEFKPYKSVFTPTGRPEVAQMLRQRYDENREQTDLVQQLLASIETRPGDSTLKDAAGDRINTELGGIIKSGRYELAGVALGNAKNILNTDPGLKAAQASYENRMADLKFLEEEGAKGPTIDWGADDWATGVSYIEGEDGTMKENVYQRQATTMYDYGKEKRSMLKTISADWTGISPDKAALIAETLLSTYLGGTNAIGEQEFRYLMTKTNLSEVENMDERQTSAIEKIRGDFQALTLQYVHQKKSEDTQNLSKEIKVGKTGFWNKKLITGQNYTNIDASSDEVSNYIKNVQEIHWDFDPKTPISYEDTRMAVNMLKIDAIAALEQSGQYTSDQIEKHISMIYDLTGNNEKYLPLAGLMDYLTLDLGPWNDRKDGVFGDVEDKFGRLADEGIGDVGLDAVGAAGSTYIGLQLLQGAWNTFGGKKVKLLKTIFGNKGLLSLGAGSGSIMYDLANNNIFNERNNVRDPKPWLIGDVQMSEEESFKWIMLNNLDWVNEKLGTEYTLDDPNYQQAVKNGLALLDWRKNHGGDEMDNIADSGKGTAFEGKVLGINDATILRNINTKLEGAGPTDFRLIGSGGRASWHDVLHGKNIVNEFKDISKKEINFKFKGIVQGSIRHDIPLSLRLEVHSDDKNGVFISEAADQDMVYQIARDGGMKHLVVMDQVRVQLNDQVRQGQLDHITPRNILSSMQYFYTQEAVSEGVYMDMVESTAISTRLLTNMFNQAHPEYIQSFTQQVQQKNEERKLNMTGKQIENEVYKLLFMVMNDANAWGGTSWMDQRLGN